MKLHFVAGILCAGLIAIGCAAEEPTDIDIESSDLEAEYVPKQPVGCYQENESTWTTTTTEQTTKTVKMCTGYDLAGRSVTCQLYNKCTKTSTWNNYCYCTEYGTDGTLVCGKTLQSTTTTCDAYVYNNCSAFIGVTC